MSTTVIRTSSYIPENAIQLFKWRFDALYSIVTHRIDRRSWLAILPRRCGKTTFLKDLMHVFGRSHHVVILVSTARVRQGFTEGEAYNEETLFSPTSVLLVDDYEHCAGSLEVIQAAMDAGSLVVATSSNVEQRPTQFATVLEYME